MRRKSLIYTRYRSALGRAIVMGLLVAADFIKTVAINPSLEAPH
ncbi:DUF1622 domain-containing protein [Cryobacterium adonitolivorans]